MVSRKDNTDVQSYGPYGHYYSDERSYTQVSVVYYRVSTPGHTLGYDIDTRSLRALYPQRSKFRRYEYVQLLLTLAY